MSRFMELLLTTARASTRGMTTGEPRHPTRRSWPEIHTLARAMATDLAGAGVAPGASVALLAGQPAHIAPAAQAVWLAGGSVTMLHQPTQRTDLAAWARDTLTVLTMISADVVLLGAPFEGVADVLTGARPDITVLRLDTLGSATTSGDGSAGDGSAGDGSAGDGSAGAGGGAGPVVLPAEDDVALLQLTSGSCAEPKAVRITHRNLYANLMDMFGAAEMHPERDVMVSWLPLFHDMGMVGFLTLPMATGLELVTVTPADFLTRPLLWAELISRHGATITAAPNFAYAMLARQLRHADDGSLDLSTMRFALNGAEPIDPRSVAAFTAAGARFGLRPQSVVAAYGMAETTLGVSFAPLETGLEVDVVDADILEQQGRAAPAGNPAADPGPAPEPSVRHFPLLGPPLPGLDARVVDLAGRVLGDREVGTLQLRGEAVTAGYLTVDGPVAAQDAEGWLDTGDQGYLADGVVVVCGRLKDVIIMGGRNIYPTDIERAAETVEGVRAGNAVAVRLDAGQGVGADGRESFAVVVESRLAGDEAGEAVLRKALTAAVVAAVNARPARVVVVASGSLPKTPSGKLRRSATRELALAR